MIRALAIAALLSLGVIMNQGPDEIGRPDATTADITNMTDGSGATCVLSTNCITPGTCNLSVDESVYSPDGIAMSHDEGVSNSVTQILKFTTPVRNLSTSANAIGLRVLVSKCNDCQEDAGGNDPSYNIHRFCDDTGLGVSITGGFVTVTGNDQLDTYDFTYVNHGSAISGSGVGCDKEGTEMELRFWSFTAGAGADERSACLEAIEILYEYGDQTDAELAPDDDTENSAVFGLGDGTNCTDDTDCDATNCEDAVDDDPESPDSNFVIAENNNDTMYFGFPTPATAPSLAVGAQTIQLTVDQCDATDCTTSGSVANYGVRIYCGTTFVVNLFAGWRIHADDQVDRFSWTFSDTSFGGACNSDGSNVRVRVQSQDLVSGVGTGRPCFEAIEWEVGY